MEAVEDDAEAVRQLGTYHAVEQCAGLLESGAAGLHFYTLNRSTATRAIYQQIKSRLPEEIDDGQLSLAFGRDA